MAVQKENAERLLSYYLCRYWNNATRGLVFSDKILSDVLGFKDNELHEAVELLKENKAITVEQIPSKTHRGLVVAHKVNPIYIQKLKCVWLTPKRYQLNKTIPLAEKLTDDFFAGKTVILDSSGLNIKYSQFQLDYFFEELSKQGVKSTDNIYNHLLNKISAKEYSLYRPQTKKNEKAQPVEIPADVVYTFNQYDIKNEQAWDEITDILDKYYYDELLNWKKNFLRGFYVVAQ